MINAINNREGFHSVGWRFAPEKVFDRQKLISLLIELKVERMKATIITDTGIFGYNLTSDGLSEVELDQCAESQIELIAEVVDETFEAQLLSCLK